jgi:putative ABC transport system substrate-binding protein
MKARSKIPSPWNLIVLIVAGMVAVSASPQPNNRITAILSTNAASYQEHLGRFQSHFPKEVKVVTLPRDTACLEKKLKQEPPGLIIALGGAAAIFATHIESPSPVLFTMVYNPEKHGLAAGPSLCGVSLKVSPKKVLKALEAVWPKVKPRIRVGALHMKGNESRELESLDHALKDRGHTLVLREVSSPEQIEDALKSMLPEVDVLWLLAEPELIPDEHYLDLVLGQALDYKVAVLGLSDAHVQLGALLAVSVDYHMEGDHAARLAKEVLEGKSPQEIGVQPPENLIWSLNLKVAREIGWEIPPLTRKRFERVYQ